MTRRALLDGARLASLEAVYDALAQQLSFPAHFGRNLDALWDVLTRDISGPIEIIWRNAARSRIGMGADFERIAAVFCAAAAERDDLFVAFEE
jgi:ribonuclease inhibitor